MPDAAACLLTADFGLARVHRGPFQRDSPGCPRTRRSGRRSGAYKVHSSRGALVTRNLGQHRSSAYVDKLGDPAAPAEISPCTCVD